jgi:para-aminobenzoate synthetase/4-amino-4-deoxychorismate lyase
MTSLVTGRTGAGLGELFAAMHPSASVTGAPKRRTMQILAELERGARGVYTGAIGHVAPDGSACFNVAIRTAVVDCQAGRVTFGVGSGIVWDSDPGDEYAECLLKGAVLGRRPAVFDLLETMRWTPRDGFFLRDRHVMRLRDSAEYFGFACDQAAIDAALASAVASATSPRRIRLLVSASGWVRAESVPLPDRIEPVRLALAHAPVDADDPLLFHKTTARGVYDRARRAGFHDTLLWNRDGHITETTTANVVGDIDGRLVTPPVGCGLLAGTFRAELIDKGRIEEQTLTSGDLARARKLWVINSVYEWREAVLTAPPA